MAARKYAVMATFAMSDLWGAATAGLPTLTDFLCVSQFLHLSQGFLFDQAFDLKEI